MSIPETRNAASPNACASLVCVVGCAEVGGAGDGTYGFPVMTVSARTLRRANESGMNVKRAVSPPARDCPGSDRALNSALNDNPKRRIHPLIVVAGTTTLLPLMFDRQPSMPAPNCIPRVDPVVPT